MALALELANSPLRALESEVLFGFLVDQVPLHLNMKHISEAEILEVLKCELS